MVSLQELRGVQKPDAKMEDILAAVIMIRNFVNFFNKSTRIIKIKLKYLQ